jgi:hypothetical protein
LSIEASTWGGTGSSWATARAGAARTIINKSNVATAPRTPSPSGRGQG